MLGTSDARSAAPVDDSCDDDIDEYLKSYKSSDEDDNPVDLSKNIEDAPSGEPLRSNVASFLSPDLYDGALTDHLRKVFNHESFHDHQLEVCKNTLAGKDAIIVMATGVGKSLMYQLPAVTLRKLGLKCTTIVVSPLLSLIEDQVQSLRSKGIEAGSITGSSTREEKEAAMSGDYVLLYTTPETITVWRDGLRTLMLNASIVCIAIDEAHWYVAHPYPLYTSTDQLTYVFVLFHLSSFIVLPVCRAACPSGATTSASPTAGWESCARA